MICDFKRCKTTKIWFLTIFWKSHCLMKKTARDPCFALVDTSAIRWYFKPQFCVPQFPHLNVALPPPPDILDLHDRNITKIDRILIGKRKILLKTRTRYREYRCILPSSHANKISFNTYNNTRAFVTVRCVIIAIHCLGKIASSRIIIVGTYYTRKRGGKSFDVARGLGTTIS